MFVDWEESFVDGEAMLIGALARLDEENKPIRYVNGRYKRIGEKESGWLYNIRLQLHEGMLVIEEVEQGNDVELPLNEIEYLKLRPYYFAACIGFKAFVFYNEGARSK